jgi:prepilin-type N-terminal cleavage/methylation domain-containing protein
VVAAVLCRAVALCVGWSAALRRIHEQKETKKTKIVGLVDLPPIHDSRFTIHQRARNAFTLIELLVVIIMIAILAGLLFPALIGTQNQAKKMQAKNDLTQIVSAVNAFYTEYGKYPVNVPSSNTTDAYFGTGTTPSGETSYGNNDVLIDVLSNNTGSTNNSTTVTTLNPRGIVFLNVPIAKNMTSPKSGVIPNGATVTAPLRVGVWYDPWGSPYNVEIDTNYDNQLKNPYLAQNVGGAGSDPVLSGVIARSFGNDQQPGTKTGSNTGDNVYRTPGGAQSDDVISWQ